MRDFQQMSAEEIKSQGNKHFSQKQYELAIDCYNKAIIKNPNKATFFTNRALCYLKLKKWDLASVDCRRAIELDNNIIKGYFFLGQALLEQQAFDESVGYLKKALDSSKEQKQCFGDDIAYVLRMAMKKRFEASEAKRIQQEVELQTYLTKLIEENTERRVSSLDSSTKEEDKTKDEETKIKSEGDKRLAEVNELFSKIDERRKAREVPDYLCGKISFDLMKDPVITPSGITYDRKDIEEHLQRVGHFDPITRTELTQDQLIPNLAMKEVVDSFVTENEWVVLDY